MMAGLMDIILSLVRALCGGSTTQEQPPTEPYVAERPPPQQVITRPQAVLETTEHRRPEESKPISLPRPDQYRPYQDQNQINQHDERYTTLRTKANEQGDLMARCFQESHEAYGSGNGARAKQLSEQGKQHERTMESLNAEASAWIFRQNNMDCKPGEVNLHGLYVKEAISYVDKSIQEARKRGDPEIRIIVGKGLHSNGQIAKIKPAIEDLMNKYNIPAQVDPHNGGVLVARLL